MFRAADDKRKVDAIHDDLRNGLFRRGDRLLLVSERARPVGAGNHAVHRVFSERVMAVKGSVESGRDALVETVPPLPCAIRYGTPGVDRTLWTAPRGRAGRNPT